MVDREQVSSVNKKNTGSIAGTWRPQRSIGDGLPTTRNDLRDVTLTFANSRCEVRRGEALIRRGSYSTDPTQSPKTIDVCFTESDVPELIDATLRGIYEVKAENLRICYGPPGGVRARSFSGEKGTGQYLAEYQRSDGV